MSDVPLPLNRDGGPPCKLALIAVAASALMYLSPAASAADDPGTFILSFARRTDAILESSAAGPTLSDRFRTLVREEIDLSGALHLILGKAWDQAETPQREQMRQAFEDYLVTLLGPRFTGFKGHYPQLRETKMLPNGQALVTTDIPAIGSGSVAVQWLLTPIQPASAGDNQKKTWRIIDVSLAGIDAATFFRDTFASMLNSGGADELIKRLEAKSRP